MSLAPARGMPLRQGILRPSGPERAGSCDRTPQERWEREGGRTYGRNWQQTSQTLTAWNISDLGAVRRPPSVKTATPQVTGTLEALDHRGQVAGSKGMGRVQGFREEIQVQPAPRTTAEAGLWPSKRQQAARCEVLTIS